MPATVAGSVCSQTSTWNCWPYFGWLPQRPLQAQVLARRQLGQVADDGHQAFTVKPRRPAALRAQAQDAVPVLRVVVGDALDRAGQCIHD